eukprot:TRINITY_DN60647_c0_g1_i1.p2 TRINITY_DN60647_c0_g1~~TRINITY_DN60647_c0_g1_i1.p2  ORF type:complete len:134 (+),score=18.58 TRINITY_DN60647_c0_g1_i1:211-612(+)
MWRAFTLAAVVVGLALSSPIPLCEHAPCSAYQNQQLCVEAPPEQNCTYSHFFGCCFPRTQAAMAGDPGPREAAGICDSPSCGPIGNPVQCFAAPREWNCTWSGYLGCCFHKPHAARLDARHGGKDGRNDGLRL